MTGHNTRSRTTPRDSDLGLRRLTNSVGLSISALANGCIFAIEHRNARASTLINQVLGSPISGGIARIYLRIGGAEPCIIQVVGPGAQTSFGAATDRFVWDGETSGVRHRLTLWLAPSTSVWLWQLEITSRQITELTCDAILVQDIGLGERGFLMSSEAYASQYIDHHVAFDADLGPVIMSRQNLRQGEAYPWVLHACLDGAAGFATDAIQLFGPAYRDAMDIRCGPGRDLPNVRLQHELACVALQSRSVTLIPGGSQAWTFACLYVPDHAEASSSADLQRLRLVRDALRDFAPREVVPSTPVRSVVQNVQPFAAETLNDAEIDRRYPLRSHEEREGALLSFFTPDNPHNRHIVLRDKERGVVRRHGTLLRTGQCMLPDESTMCATCWMHGVFGAQLTIGNTSFHKLFSVSRDPYNITRASGLRILADIGGGWRLLAVPSAFEIGLSDCRWIYRHGDRTITVHVVAAGDDPALQWQITVDGAPCRFLVFGHLVLGERELDHAACFEIDDARKWFAFRPDPDSLWGRHYPDAVYHLVVSTPAAVDDIGGDELLFAENEPQGGAYVVIRTRSTNELCFSVVGSLHDSRTSTALAHKYATVARSAAMLAPAASHWKHVTRGLRMSGSHPDISALDTILPWFAHNAMMHLTVPHGLEQYTGAAWGTRDVCQGPVEFLLALEHDEPVKEILRIVFAQQYEARGDWPQWFMLEPYASIQDPNCHGDILIWPLKALCDYLESTNDLAFLEERVAWRREDGFVRTERKDPIAAHVGKLLDVLGQRFIPGTRLLKLGNGDWNDSLQPVDPDMRERMVSSWTVALMFQQINRYADVLRRAGRNDEAKALEVLAAETRADFNSYLISGGVVAGYAVFDPPDDRPRLLLHPSDTVTGISYSLLPMTRSIIAALFTSEQAQHHLQLIREHLLFPDGARLMDKPVVYRGGAQRVFRRAESASFFGREIGLMYVHAYLRYGEAMAVLGEADALWDALLQVNPVSVSDRVSIASTRQRNAYFSSSDAAFRDRYQASAEWDRLKSCQVPVDAGWRIYSSGPGIYMRMLLCEALGIRRYFGERGRVPLLPAWLGEVRLERPVMVV